MIPRRKIHTFIFTQKPPWLSRSKPLKENRLLDRVVQSIFTTILRQIFDSDFSSPKFKGGNFPVMRLFIKKKRKDCFIELRSWAEVSIGWFLNFELKWGHEIFSRRSLIQVKRMSNIVTLAKRQPVKYVFCCHDGHTSSCELMVNPLIPWKSSSFQIIKRTFTYSDILIIKENSLRCQKII